MDLPQLVYSFVRGAFVLPFLEANTSHNNDSNSLASFFSASSNMTTTSAPASAWVAFFTSALVQLNASFQQSVDKIRMAVAQLSGQRFLQLLGFLAGFAYSWTKLIVAQASQMATVARDARAAFFYDDEGNMKYDLLFHIVLGTWLLSIAACIFLCLRTILGRGARAYRRLARNYNKQQGSEPWCFSCIAVVAFALAAYFWYVQLRLSYDAWRQAAVEGRRFTRGEMYHCGIGPGKEKTEEIGCRSLWLIQTDLVAEILEIPFGKPRRRWWAHQVIAGTVPWTMFVAVEGSWRRMAHWPVFVWLAVAFSLPLAQALFFQSVLCTPNDYTGVILFDRSTKITDFVVPLGPTTSNRMQARMKGPNLKIFSSSPSSESEKTKSIWLGLQGMLLQLQSMFAMILICMLCLTDRTPAFKYCTAALFVVFCMPIVLKGRLNVRRVFRFTAYLSTVMYWWLTFIALLDHDNTESHYNIHSDILHSTVAHLSAGSQCSDTRGFSLVFDSVNDHPSVKRFGVEVVLSAMVMGLWAFHRGLRPQEILSCMRGPKLTDDQPPSSMSLVAINTDGVSRERPENAKSGVLVWAFSVMFGLGASTSGVLASEMLTVQ